MTPEARMRRFLAFHCDNSQVIDGRTGERVFPSETATTA